MSSSDSNDSEFEELVISCAQENSADSDEILKKKKPRKTEDPEDEKELNAFLFGDKDSLIKNLEGQKASVFTVDASGSVKKEVEEEDAQKNQCEIWYDSDDEDDDGHNLDGTKNKFTQINKKRKLERITGNAPKWAQLDRKDAGESEDSDDEIIKKSVGFKSTSSNKGGFLARGEINFKRLKNVNRTTANEGVISSVEFHPNSFVGIVAGRKGFVSMFAIDGKENRKIHNICYEKFFIHSCKLTNSGEELIIGGQLRDFHTYNLMSDYKQRIRLPVGVNHMKHFQLSPCGKYIAVIGDYGEVHLLHAVTKELLSTMKQEHQSTYINFSANSNELYSHSDDNEVTIFDIRTHRIKHRFVDDGCVNGTSLALSNNGKFLATGSRQGFVNLYDCADIALKKYPKPLKIIDNLTTEITDLKFNHNSELLAMCSNDDNNALKLLHVQSATVFSNFPSHLDKIGQPTTVVFSPESGYLGLGNLSSEVPLYRLMHYNNY